MHKKTPNRDLFELSMLDNWCPPEGAGEPIGLIATSYTFDANFFESQCLARFVGMSSDSNSHNFAYLVEKEEKLAQLKFCTVLVDHQNSSGVRNLRWDLVSVNVPKGTMHSKIFCLCWEDYYRIIIGSANLTESGQCRNREVFVSLEGRYDKVGEEEYSLDGLSGHLNKIASFSGLRKKDLYATERFNLGLDYLNKNILNTQSNQDKDISLVFVDPKSPDSLFKQVIPELPHSKANKVIVTSPFFDEEMNEENLRVSMELETYLANQANIRIIGPAEKDDHTKRIKYLAPESVLKGYSGKREVEYIPYFPVSELNEDIFRRELHMKSYYFRRNDAAVFVVGSSNFTKPGLGIKPNKHSRKNFEANVVFRIDCSERKMISYINSINPPLNYELNHNYDIIWNTDYDLEDKIDEKKENIPLFFDIITMGKKDGRRFLDIYTKGKIEQGWKLYLDNSFKEEVYNSSKWEGSGSKELIHLPLPEHRKAQCELFVELDSGLRFSLPVLVDSDDVSLSIPEIENLNVEDFILIYLSGKPVYKIIDKVIKSKKETEGGSDNSKGLVNSLKRVDQSTFLLNRARQLSALIGSLRTKFERPIYSESFLKLLIDGPIGIYKVAEAIAKMKGSEKEEIAFFIGEMCFELKHLEIEELSTSLPAKTIQRALSPVISNLWKKHCVGIKKKSSIYQYIEELGKRVIA